MKQYKNLKILAIVGLAGSGKTTVTDYLTEKSHPKVHFGQVIMSELERQGLEPTLENEKIVRDTLRKDEGSDIVVRRIIEQINDLATAGQHRIIADGMGSWEAYKILRHEFPGELVTVAITAPRHTRHHRLTQRAERPLTQMQADLRDYDEIETLGKGGVIAIADYFVTNNGSRERLKTQIDDLLMHIDF